MNLIQLLKGVWSKMIGPKTVENILHITPTISPVMKENIELWEDMYMNNAPWLYKSPSTRIVSLGLPAMIASEKARTATIEMEVKVTGESERAKFIEKQFNKVLCSVREQLEYGIALGGFVIKPYPVLGVDGKYVLEFTYTKATNFYPLSFSPEGKVVEAAFVDRIITKDASFSKVEYHKLVGTTLIVVNKAFRLENTQAKITSAESELGTPIPLSSVTAWANIQPEVTIENIDCMLFAYFKMPEANNVDMNSPLGVSGFSKAVDLIEDADKQYSNLLWEFEGGQLAVDVDRTALNPMHDSKGRAIETLPALQDRLFRRSLDLGADDTYNVFSPNLRDTNIINGLNNILTHIEDVCAISRGTLSQVQYTDARTATELKILKQRSYSANADIQKELQSTLEAVLAIMDKYCDLYEICPRGDFEVAYKWDDSIIVDKDSERQVDLIDVNAGLMSKVEYRMKWYGETEVQAEEAVKRISDEKMEQLTMQQQVVTQTQQDNGTPTTDAEAKQNKMQRATESNEPTSK